MSIKSNTQNFFRRPSKKIWVGSVPVGGDAPVAVQTMNNCRADDVEGNLAQLRRLAACGCEISRLSVPDREAAKAFARIATASELPLVADIHYDWRLALAALEGGAMALRINPGNIHDREGLRRLAKAAQARRIPIRVGVNAGSLSERILAEEGGVNKASLVRSALEAVRLLEDEDFDDIGISLKASDPRLMIEAYREIADKTPYPLHLGVTEAGTPREGIIRSAVGIGTLLAEGIGDTLRVSLTAEPEEEVEAAYAILKALRLREHGATLISCPGCGRTEVPLQRLSLQVEAYLRGVSKPITVAVMGCAVNGPGEASEADLGLAGGKDQFLLFKKGKIIAKVRAEQAYEKLVEEIERVTAEMNGG